jgi:exonuclease SbcC
MKILAIRMKNLASLDGMTEIDFIREPLCSAGIFAITGSTGAGKSTILDALCLALYARTPRYRLAEHGVDIMDVQGSTIKQDDVRGILRDGTSDGFAEVDFEGVDGYSYRANWSVRRARNRADGNLQAYEVSLKNITTHQEIPGRKTELLAEIERLVGLNFEQFTRSVLLAQGDFTAFLKAGKDEKSSLLEKLTGTHIYSEISKKVYEHYKEQQQKLRELNLQREGIPTLTHEELNELEERKAALTILIKNNEKLSDTLNKEINWHEQWVKLQENMQTAVFQHAHATAIKTEAQPREQQLQQIIRVQPAREIVNGLQNAREQIAVKKSASGDISLKLDTLNGERKTADIVFAQAAAALETAVQKEEKAQPLLNKAKALDIQLTEKAEQVKRTTDEFSIISEKVTYQKGQLSLTKKNLEDLEKEIGKLGQWKGENESRRPIAEQESLILSKLTDAEEILKNVHDYTIRIQETEKKIIQHGQEKQILEDKRNTLMAAHRQKQGEFQNLHTTLSAIPIQDIEKEKSSLDTFIEEIVTADAHWKILHQAIMDHDNISRSLLHNKKELEQYKVQLSEAENLLQTKLVEKEISLKSLEKAKLIMAESVERLRDQLEPGEPCPVCGGTDHPYAEKHPLTDQLLSELESTYTQSEAAYSEQLTIQSRIRQICVGLEKSIGELEKTLTDKNVSIKELEVKWSEFRISGKCEQYPLSDRAIWLQDQLQEHKSRQRQLLEQIQSYGKQKELLELYKTNLAMLDKELTDHENRIKDNERILKSLQELQENDTAAQRKTAENLEIVKRAVAVYFPAEEWFENWQYNPRAFVNQIREFARNWKINTTRLEEQFHQQKMLVEKIKGMEGQLKEIKEDSRGKGEYLAGLQTQYKELTGQRGAIFNGAPVMEVEARLKEMIRLGKQALDEQKKKVDTIQAEITRLEAQHEQLEKDISVLTRQESAANEQLEKWVIHYNQQYNAELATSFQTQSGGDSWHNPQYDAMLTREKLQSLLEFTQDWIENERNNLQEIDNAVMQAGSILGERTKALEKHVGERPSERILEELTSSQNEVRELLRQSSQEANEIDFNIKQDTLNKQRIGSLLKEIEKQTVIEENWAKLNDIIGSADGKKFRQIAQEYTLDVLLSYANVHLEILSKRYLLQRIPNSLGLQVVDQDMGDEVRTVYSLSGGESFLVSLALALGLASLSSSRMKVESLFIDEGFGSLDPTTLNIAMDALERLHNQGRKVGVISHVQEMTERIPVQIRVSKQQSGKSKVKVVSV